MNETNIAIDIGFGSIKVAYGDSEIRHFKRTSAIAEVDEGSIYDENQFEFKDKKYYLFEPALKLPVGSTMNLMEYEELKIASPIIISKILKELDIKPNKIVLGLSLSFLNESGDYLSYVSTELGIPSNRFLIIPQGVGAKIYYSKVGLDENSDDPVRMKNYLIVDIGFNTLDIIPVISSSTSSHLSKGIEKHGIKLVSETIIEELKLSYGINLDMQQVKSVIETGSVKVRNVSNDVKDLVEKSVISYIKTLKEVLESEFGDTMNNMEGILLIGGGANVIKSVENFESNLEFPEGFINTTAIESEFYNVKGYLNVSL